MKIFNIGNFYFMTTFLSALSSSTSTLKWAKQTEGQGDISQKYDKISLPSHIQEFASELSNIGMDDAAIELTRLKNTIIRHPQSANDEQICELIESFRGRLHDALKKPFFLILSESEKNLYNPKSPLFGDAVDNSFPSARSDISEAGKCLALDRPTACVMHLMRALEVSLGAIARYFAIQDHSNWNKTLNEIESRCRSITKKTNGAEDEIWFSETAIHLRLIKNAWRNHSMHSKSTYSNEEAKKIFEHTKFIMVHISSRIHE